MPRLPTGAWISRLRSTWGAAVEPRAWISRRVRSERRGAIWAATANRGLGFLGFGMTLGRCGGRPGRLSGLVSSVDSFIRASPRSAGFRPAPERRERDGLSASAAEPYVPRLPTGGLDFSASLEMTLGRCGGMTLGRCGNDRGAALRWKAWPSKRVSFIG